MRKLRSITGAVAGVCGTALLVESTAAQEFPPAGKTNGAVPVPTPNWTSTNTPTQAGVYQAEPYKMLVVVPGTLIDSKMVMRPPITPTILQHVPDVQLAPRTHR